VPEEVLRDATGCPRQKRARGSSIASMTPSGAVADTTNSRATFFHRTDDGGCSPAALRPPAARASASRAASPLSTHTSCAQLVRLMLRHRQRVGERAPRCATECPCTSVPPERDVEHLHAAADREDRQVCGRGPRQPGAISNSSSPRFGLFDGRMRRLAVARMGATSPPAGQHHAVDCRSVPARIAIEESRHARFAADVKD